MQTRQILITLFVISIRQTRQNPIDDMSPTIITRAQWHAKPPHEPYTPLPRPVPYVIIHHSYQPKSCQNPTECILAMQTMQNMHQIQNKWNDIGYNFAIGGPSGEIYEGRGWQAVGAHATTFNSKSIGICIIGDWSEILPNEFQLASVKKLIEYGVANGHIDCNYGLIGHRQVKNSTECPGLKLFQELHSWPHFTDQVD